MKDYSELYKITSSVSDAIRRRFSEVFEKGYELGHEDGLKEKPEKIYEMQKECFEKGVKKAEENAKEVRDEAIDEAYSSALRNAWECARRMISLWVNSVDKFAEIFGKGKSLTAVMEEFSASEAMKMISEYEKKKEQMTVEEAQAILDKVKACENRIIDTHYCESHSCKGCHLNVSDKQIDEARSVLKD